MIIDLHTRVWKTPEQLGQALWDQIARRHAGRWLRVDATPTALAPAVECLSGAAVLGYRSDLIGACVPHEFIAECVRRDPQRLFGIGGVDPMAPDPLGQVDRAVALGLVGVTVSPASQGFHPAHSVAMRVYERCLRLGLPVLSSRCGPLVSSAVLEFDRPAAWDEVARTFPRLPIVISGLGWPWIDECLELLGKHECVYADISGFASRPWDLHQALLAASSHGVLERILFGSGFPFELPARMIECIYSLQSFAHGTQLPAVPRAALRAIVERNALEALGIDAPGFIGGARRAERSIESDRGRARP
ncbi:MAG: amidohydrolase family protein [Phycisphaeraceae bacterium]|nr:amidohydrolase family protein [Phycisphaeraceae bacterium]